MVKWITITGISAFLLFGNYNFVDLKEAIVYYGTAITSTYPSLGIAIFILMLSLLIFPNEIISMFKTGKNKIKVRENF